MFAPLLAQNTQPASETDRKAERERGTEPCRMKIAQAKLGIGADGGYGVFVQEIIIHAHTAQG